MASRTRLCSLNVQSKHIDFRSTVLAQGVHDLNQVLERWVLMARFSYFFQRTKNKLLLKSVERCNPCDYLVKVQDGKEKIFHVN